MPELVSFANQVQHRDSRRSRGGCTGIKVQLVHGYDEIISIENLLAAWREFIRGKCVKSDVQEFQRNLYDNILTLHKELANKTYRHGGYQNFNVSDPKPRKISKAFVRDRLLHHAVYRTLYPYFDKLFIYDSYSCRVSKGTHRAVKRLRTMFIEASNCNRKTCWVLKLDIRKFFASIDHKILIDIFKEYIRNEDILWLLEGIIQSFPQGLPLGNLTSQLFVNIYMNEFDQFVKHELKIEHYIRYADDFVILSSQKQELVNILPKIDAYLLQRLKLSIHPAKIFLKTYASGIDFLGWVNFPSHQVLRTTSKRRMLSRITASPRKHTLESYYGLLQHGNTRKIKSKLLNNYFLFKRLPGNGRRHHHS